MARSMRASHSNSALLVGSARLLDPHEEKVVEKLWYNREQVRFVEQKAEHVGQQEAFRSRAKAGRKLVLCVRRVCAQRAR